MVVLVHLSLSAFLVLIPESCDGLLIVYLLVAKSLKKLQILVKKLKQISSYIGSVIDGELGGIS